MKKARTAAAVAFATSLLASSALAGGSFEVRLGAFVPAANSNLFADTNELFAVESVARRLAEIDFDRIPDGVSKADWVGGMGGAEIAGRIGRNVELGFHVDGYSRQLDTVYRDHFHQDWRMVPQTFRLQFVPVGVSFRLINNSRRARLSPYVSVGGDMVHYSYTEEGEFVDFYDANKEIYDDYFESSGWLPGAHVAAGVRVPVGDDFRLVLEGKYLWTARKLMNGDRSLNEIDASGLAITAGLNVRF